MTAIAAPLVMPGAAPANGPGRHGGSGDRNGGLPGAAAHGFERELERAVERVDRGTDRSRSDRSRTDRHGSDRPAVDEDASPTSAADRDASEDDATRAADHATSPAAPTDDTAAATVAGAQVVAVPTDAAAEPADALVDAAPLDEAPAEGGDDVSARAGTTARGSDLASDTPDGSEATGRSGSTDALVPAVDTTADAAHSGSTGRDTGGDPPTAARADRPTTATAGAGAPVEPSAAAGSADPAGAATQVAPARPAPTPSPVPAAAPAPQPDPVEQVLRTEELAESLRASFRRGETSSNLSIELHPAELGAVRIEARLVDGVTHLVLRAESAMAVDRLGSALEELRNDLARDGVDVGDLQLRQDGTGGHDGDATDSGSDRTGVARRGSPTTGTNNDRDPSPIATRHPGGSLALDL